MLGNRPRLKSSQRAVFFKPAMAKTPIQPIKLAGTVAGLDTFDVAKR
jgi:hypothetical protein